MLQVLFVVVFCVLFVTFLFELQLFIVLRFVCRVIFGVSACIEMLLNCGLILLAYVVIFYFVFCFFIVQVHFSMI